jgi:hypothetical protein
VRSLGFVFLKGSPWTACTSSAVNNLQAKSPEPAVTEATDEAGAADGVGEAATTGLFVFEQAAVKTASAKRKMKYGQTRRRMT